MQNNYTNRPFDIVIQAGQSNAEGIGRGDIESPYQLSHYDFSSNMTIAAAAEQQHDGQPVNNLSLSFGQRYTSQRLTAGRHLLVIRAAVSGTGFSDRRWTPDGDLYRQMLAMTDAAMGLNNGNKLSAFLWHQGETDALNNMDENTYYSHLACLVQSVRGRYGLPGLPFVCGDFVQQWKAATGAISHPIIAAQRRLCGDIAAARFVETDGLQSNDQRIRDGDTIHFCREALRQLGERYYDAYADIAG